MGVIGRPYGVRGFLHITSYAENLTAYGPLSDERNRRFVLRWRGEGVAEVAEIIDGAEVKVADRTTAERLTNTRLFIERARLPEPDDDEFYLADLIGLVANDAEGNDLGAVSAVHDYGAGVSLEIIREGAAPIIVPFTRACVPHVDIPGSRLIVAPPIETDVSADQVT